MQVVLLKVELGKLWVEVGVLVGQPFLVVGLGHYGGQGLQVGGPGSLLPCWDKKC